MTRMLSRALPLTAALITLCGCSNALKPVGLDPSVRPVGTNLPQPVAADYANPARAYYIGPGDRLNIDVFGVPELAREIQIDAAGKLSFPLIGELNAAGNTPGDLADLIESRLRGQYIRNPEVTVNLKESPNQLVAVDGQVVRPGMYPVTGRMTLIRVVALAGSTSEFARLDDVVIMREVAGQTYLGLYNLEAIRRGNYPDPDIYPNDRVVVGDSQQRRLFRDLIQAAPLLTSPLILLLQN